LKPEELKMIAYLYKSPRNAWKLTIVTQPKNYISAGPEFTVAEYIALAEKRQASAICRATAICKLRGVKPWNF